MMNEHRGETAVAIGGRTHVLRFTWDAIAQLRAAFGPEYDERISKALDGRDVEAIAKVVAIGTGGELEPREIIEASPPLVATSNAVFRALYLAYYGPDGPPPRDEEAQGKPKTRAVTWWRKLCGLLLGSGAP